MGIGSDLREAREQRGITLRDISDRTKIRQAVLRAIENDDFQGLPGSVIMRGFLKLYAREVGLDPDEIGRRYTAEVEVPANDELVTQAQAGDRARGESTRRLLMLAIGAAALVALVWLGYRLWGPSPSARSVTEAARPSGAEAEPPVPRQPPVAAAPPGAPPSGMPASGVSPATNAAAVAPGSAANPPASDGLRVTLQATDASWIAANADGAQVAYRVLNAGERLEMQVKEEAVLRIGLPANVTVTVNGRPLKPFGRPGNPTTLRITPDTYRELLVP